MNKIEIESITIHSDNEEKVIKVEPLNLPIIKNGFIPDFRYDKLKSGFNDTSNFVHCIRIETFDINCDDESLNSNTYIFENEFCRNNAKQLIIESLPQKNIVGLYDKHITWKFNTEIVKIYIEELELIKEFDLEILSYYLKLKSPS